MTSKLNPSASKRNLLEFKLESGLNSPHLLYSALTLLCRLHISKSNLRYLRVSV